MELYVGAIGVAVFLATVAAGWPWVQAAGRR